AQADLEELLEDRAPAEIAEPDRERVEDPGEEHREEDVSEPARAEALAARERGRDRRALEDDHLGREAEEARDPDRGEEEEEGARCDAHRLEEARADDARQGAEPGAERAAGGHLVLEDEARGKGDERRLGERREADRDRPAPRPAPGARSEP